MENRARPVRERKEVEGGLTNLEVGGRRGHHGTDKEPEGLSSKGENGILI